MKKLLTVFLAAALALTIVGCAPKVRDDDQFLEIYVLDVGYGKDWCDAIADEFKKQDWVKEKYPNLDIGIQFNDIVSYGASKVEGGPAANSIDLIFDEQGSTMADKYLNGERIVCDLTEVVFNQKVPGEDVYYKDKMLPSIRDSSRYLAAGYTGEEEAQYFYAPWYIGMAGINYNEEILDAFNLEVPLTTDQWLDSMEVIKQANGSNPAYPYTYSLLQSKDAPNYCEYLMPVWWAQYSGSDEYANFYSGIVNGRRSKDIFKNMGRLYNLEVMEEAFRYDNGYLSPSSFQQDYMITQTQVISGEAVYYICGDWFDREMIGVREEMEEANRTVYNTKMMRTPIVSAIVEKTPSIVSVAENDGDPDTDADDILAEVVKAVDANDYSQAPEGVTETDYETIADARRVTMALGSFSSAYVPSYATAKDIAFDFLLFMATDIAQDAYIRATNGASLPFTYNVKEKNPELFESISPYQQVRQEYFISESLPLDILPMPNMFPLARYGGVGAYTWSNIYTTFSASGNTRHAQDFYDATIANWTDQKWREALAAAALPA